MGEGWHEEFGGPHAEVQALEDAGLQAHGAVAYVSFEPCSHVGKTPPCATALATAGVRRVVFGSLDMGEKSGGGAQALRLAGVDVVGPVWDIDVAYRENPAFFHERLGGGTYVALKLAVTLDGRIARRQGERTPITGPEAWLEVQRLRAGHDAIVVGAGTARVDDPRLTVRAAVPMRKTPARIVLDSMASLSPGASLFTGDEEAPVLVFVHEDAPESARERLEASGASIHVVPAAPGGLSLDAVLDVCQESGIRSLLCEGGSRLASSLLRQGRLGRIYLFVAPTVFGENGVPAFPGQFADMGFSGWSPSLAPRTFGRDVLLTYDLVPGRDR